jgi:hypothetical protein
MPDLERYRDDEAMSHDRDLVARRSIAPHDWSVWPGLLLALAIVAIALIGHAVIQTYFSDGAVTARPDSRNAVANATRPQPRQQARRIASEPELLTESAGLMSSQPTESAEYMGNTRSRVFHRSSCQYAGCPNCTASFRTREEAVASGFRPAGCCHP